MHLRGVITYRFPGTLPRFVIQDATRRRCRPAGSNVRARWPIGDEVDVIGASVPLSGSPEVLASDVTVRLLGASPRRAAHRAGDLRSGRHEGRMVELEGIVEAARVEQSGGGMFGRWDVASAGGDFSAIVPDESSADAEAFVNARVRLRGVARTVLNARGLLVHAQVLVSGRSQVTVVEASPDDPYAAPLQTVARLGTLTLPQHRVRLLGRLESASDGGVVVTDGTGSVPVHGPDLVPAPGTPVERSGRLRRVRGPAESD